MHCCCQVQSRVSSFFVNLIVKKLNQIPNIWPFLSAVNRKCYSGYDGTVARPIYMRTLLKNVQQHKYKDRRDLLRDLVLIRDNFVAFKGPGPENNRAVHEIVTICKNIVDNFSGLVGLRVCGFVGLWVCWFACFLVGWFIDLY